VPEKKSEQWILHKGARKVTEVDLREGSWFLLYANDSLFLPWELSASVKIVTWWSAIHLIHLMLHNLTFSFLYSKNNCQYTLTLSIKALWFFKTVTVNQLMCHNIPDELNLLQHHCKNLKSCKFFFVVFYTCIIISLLPGGIRQPFLL